jgi:diaminopimelate epimerase
MDAGDDRLQEAALHITVISKSMIPFVKMHGAGNDFVILDRRTQALPPLDWRRLADRHKGIGCDQMIVLERPRDAQAEAMMRIYNADGSESASCGNASRCVGRLLLRESGKERVGIETLAGIVTAQASGKEEWVTVDMGAPRWEWHEIPLAEACDALHLSIEEGELRDPAGVSMGNPHMVFFVEDLNGVPLERLGPLLERHPLFPERANVSVAQMRGEEIFLRVYERGAGLTLACGTAACAALVTAHRRGLTGRSACVTLPGGTLLIAWRVEDDHVLMTGEAALSYEGRFAPEAYAPGPEACTPGPEACMPWPKACTP